MTYAQLVNEFKSLSANEIIMIDSFAYRVVTNHHDDHLFLCNVTDESKSFHLFYNELNTETDTFKLLGNKYAN